MQQSTRLGLCWIGREIHGCCERYEGLYKPLVQAVPLTEKWVTWVIFKKYLQCVLVARILTVDFVVCTLAVKKKIRAGFDLSDRTIPLWARSMDTVPECSKASRPIFMCQELHVNTGKKPINVRFGEYGDHSLCPLGLTDRPGKHWSEQWRTLRLNGYCHPFWWK
jgi:hypothetical protein